jgi:S-formylglutathione hydrolase FrmB
MKQLCTCAAVILATFCCASFAKAQVLPRPFAMVHAKKELNGQIIDFTHNHGHDRRLWSKALNEKRDLYVYLPPCFNPKHRYPLGIFLHGAGQDEQFFLEVVKLFDRAIAEGKMPPVILAAPDGSLPGRPSFLCPASFFANTRAGRFEDYVMCDVWDFMMETFPIRPERDAHGIFGVSMGGSAAFTHAIKHRDRLKLAVGFAPALNLRWVDCHGKYETHFDPDCWGWREKPNRLEIIGRPNLLVKMRFGTLFGPIIGYGPDAIVELSKFNPIEIMAMHNLQPGDLDLYVAYGGHDEFNIAAQVESFLFAAKLRGVEVTVDFDPKGRHDFSTGERMMPRALEWVAPRVAAFAPHPN